MPGNVLCLMLFVFSSTGGAKTAAAAVAAATTVRVLKIAISMHDL